MKERNLDAALADARAWLNGRADPDSLSEAEGRVRRDLRLTPADHDALRMLGGPGLQAALRDGTAKTGRVLE